MWLINGESRHCIDITDRGLHYGDGLFETIEVVAGKPLFLNRHLQRMQRGCRVLLIPCPDLNLLDSEARQICDGAQLGVLKLMLTRGSGGRGYRQPEQISPSRIFGLHPHPDYPDPLYRQGIKLRFCDKRLAINPDLAQIKHLNRLEQVLARAEWQTDDIHEGLMLDSEGYVVEGTMSNLFWVRRGVLHTPLLDRCGIAGIVRELVIELARTAGIEVLEDRVDSRQLLEADEIFVTNSVIGIWPVKQLQQQSFIPGTVTVSLLEAYADLREREAAHA